MKTPSFTAKQRATEIPINDPWWKDVLQPMILSERISIEMKKRLQHEPLMCRLYSGDETIRLAAIELAEDVELELIDRNDAARNGSTHRLTIEPDPKHLERLESAKRRTRSRYERQLAVRKPAADHEAVSTNLIYRFAQIQEKALCLAVREWLPYFSEHEKQYSRSELGFGARVDRQAILEITKAYQDLGLPIDILAVTMSRVAKQDVNNRSKKLRSATKTIQELIINQVAADDCPERVKAAFARALLAFHLKRPQSLIAVLVVPDGDTSISLECFTEGFIFWTSVACEVLAARYSWKKEGAMAFLASGKVPECQRVRIDYDVRTEPNSLSRIHLAIDPQLEPDEVRDLFAHAKRVVLPLHREISEMKLAMANHVFSQTHRDTTSESTQTWKELMQSWNRWVPILKVSSQRGGSETYTSVSKFQRDARHAKYLLLNPKFSQPVKNPEFPPRHLYVRNRKKPPAGSST